MPEADAGLLQFGVNADGTGAYISTPGWNGFALGPLTCAVKADGRELRATRATAARLAEGGVEIGVDFADPSLRLTHRLSRAGEGLLAMRGELTNTASSDVTLNRGTMLHLDLQQAGAAAFGVDPSQVRIYEQSAHVGRVRPLGKVVKTEGTGSEPGALEMQESTSQLCWVAYDLAARRALLVGYETSERWLGTVRVVAHPTGRATEWSTGFDGGDLRLLAGETLTLEEMVFMVGGDPLAMLEDYGQRVAARNQAVVPDEIPVSFCSWYPYRLAVTEERMLANARVAAERLKPLGLSIMEIDLGWERQQIPASFEENELFPHGLRWLADRLGELGLKLGVWKGPYTISQFDPIFREHPEWLMAGEDGQPHPLGEWSWQPHGQTYALDLTHLSAHSLLGGDWEEVATRARYQFQAAGQGGAFIVSNGSGICDNTDPAMVDRWIAYARSPPAAPAPAPPAPSTALAPAHCAWV